MKFDTRNKKPNVRIIAWLTAAVVLLILFPVRSEKIDHLKWINPVLALYFAAVVFILFDALRKQLQYNPYSYNTIIYSGFGIFLMSAVVTHGHLAAACLRDPGSFSEREMLLTLLNSAKRYLDLSAPFLFLLSAGLLLSNLIIFFNDKKSLKNLLAMILALMIVGGWLVIHFLGRYIERHDPEGLLPNLFINLAAAVYLYFECMLIGTMIANAICARYHPDPDKDYLIVLGAGLEKDGTPTKILANRLDLALGFYRDQLKKERKHSFFVVSGGQGSDEVCSEAASMKKYLLGKGISEDRILEEDRSVNTAENMLFSKEIIMSRQRDAKIAFFTSDFHVFRAGLRARRVKMRAVGMGARTRWYYWPNAAVREFIGLLVSHRMKQACVLLGITAVYTVLTFLAFG